MLLSSFPVRFTVQECAAIGTQCTLRNSAQSIATCQPGNPSDRFRYTGTLASHTLAQRFGSPTMSLATRAEPAAISPPSSFWAFVPDLAFAVSTYLLAYRLRFPGAQFRTFLPT